MEWPSSDPGVHSSLSAPLLPACGFAPQDQCVLSLPSSWLHNPVIDLFLPPHPTHILYHQCYTIYVLVHKYYVQLLSVIVKSSRLQSR